MLPNRKWKCASSRSRGRSATDAEETFALVVGRNVRVGLGVVPEPPSIGSPPTISRILACDGEHGSMPLLPDGCRGAFGELE